MPRNPHRPGSSASQSFSADEVEWLDQVLAVLRRGGDPSVLLRNPASTRVAAKVDVMKRSIARQKRRLS